MEEDGPRVGRRGAERNGPKDRLGKLDAWWKSGKIGAGRLGWNEEMDHNWGLRKWAAEKKSIQIFIKDLDLKPKIQIVLNQNLNWGQTKINLNTLYKDFSNLKLFKISLNIQIQTKALNRGLLNWLRKRFRQEIKIFLKSKIDLGLRKKCMPWNASYQIIQNFPIAI
jgi:hypothetical protein